MFGHYHLMQAIATVSAQVNHCERLLNFIISHNKIEIPQELIDAADKLDRNTKTLQAALDAQASTPKTEG